MNTAPPETDDALGPVLMRFPSVSLAEMDAIRLMNRIDTKYLTDTEQLKLILEDALHEGYRVFEESGRRIHRYDSIYFDTESLEMFRHHRSGKATRQKIRTRQYLDSSLSFLEVKRKNNRKRTRKKRMSLPPEEFRDFRSDTQACAWLGSHSDYTEDQIAPSVETKFSRITLVDSDFSERLTIDTQVVFRNLRLGTVGTLGEAVIIELKTDSRKRSRMQDILLRHRVKPAKISKYCMGVVTTDQTIAPGRFKVKMRMIAKINKNLYLKCHKPIIYALL